MSEQNINNTLRLVMSLLDSNNSQLTSNIKLIASIGWSIPLEMPYEQFDQICKDKKYIKKI